MAGDPGCTGALRVFLRIGCLLGESVGRDVG